MGYSYSDTAAPSPPAPPTRAAGTLAGVLRAHLPASVLTLDEVLDLVAEHGRLVLELKEPEAGVVGTVDAIISTLRRHHLHDVVVSSFDRWSLRQLRVMLDEQRNLTVRTALLGRPGVPLSLLVDRAVRGGHDQVHPHVLSALAQLDRASRAAEQGMSVTPWTVNRQGDLRRVAEAGVDAVISDDPIAGRWSLQTTVAERTG